MPDMNKSWQSSNSSRSYASVSERAMESIVPSKTWQRSDGYTTVSDGDSYQAETVHSVAIDGSYYPAPVLPPRADNPANSPSITHSRTKFDTHIRDSVHRGIPGDDLRSVNKFEQFTKYNSSVHRGPDSVEINHYNDNEVPMSYMGLPTSGFSSGGELPPAALTRTRFAEHVDVREIPASTSFQRSAPAGASRTDMIEPPRSSTAKGGFINTCVRARPPDPIVQWERIPGVDFRPDRHSNWRIWSGKLQAYEGTKLNTFEFQNVFDHTSTTRDLYDVMCRSVVDSVADGVNGTIFAYGQTNSGKTFTISGKPDSPGVVHLAANQLFSLLRAQNQLSGIEFKVTASFLEIYNEQLTDMFYHIDPTSFAVRKLKKTDKPPILTIRDDVSNIDKSLIGTSVVVDGISEFEVHDENQVSRLHELGEVRRHVGRNNAHDFASRSHSILRLKIERKNRSTFEYLSSSILSIVDLAGSEAVYEPAKSTDNDYSPFDKEPIRLGLPSPRLMAKKKEYKTLSAEGGNIRKSLLALVRVVRTLAKASRQGDTGNPHVPYRDSKLTRLLANAVGGSSKTVIVCTINPAEIKETVSTLYFAQDASCVKARIPQRNISTNDSIEWYKEELFRLQRDLNEALKEREAYKSRLDGELEAKLKMKEDNAERQRQIEIRGAMEEMERKQRELQRIIEDQREEIEHAKRRSPEEDNLKYVLQTKEEQLRLRDEELYRKESCIEKTKDEVEQKTAQVSLLKREVEELKAKQQEKHALELALQKEREEQERADAQFQKRLEEQRAEIERLNEEARRQTNFIRHVEGQRDQLEHERNDALRKKKRRFGCFGSPPTAREHTPLISVQSGGLQAPSHSPQTPIQQQHPHFATRGNHLAPPHPAWNVPRGATQQQQPQRTGTQVASGGRGSGGPRGPAVRGPVPRLNFQQIPPELRPQPVPPYAVPAGQAGDSSEDESTVSYESVESL